VLVLTNNHRFAPSSWLAAGDCNFWEGRSLLMGEQLLLVGQHEWQ
jgi:hypothetical protein